MPTSSIRRIGKYILAPFVVRLLQKRFALFLCTLFLLSSPLALHASTPFVAHFSPNGIVEGPIEIFITFSTEMVKSDEVGKQLSLGEMPISLAPSLPGNGKWRDALTFIYQPSSGSLQEATEYRAALCEGLTDLSGSPVVGKREFLFRTPPLRLLGVRQIDFDVRNDYVDYELNFSTHVSPLRLRGYTEVRDESEEQFSSASRSRNKTSISVHPKLSAIDSMSSLCKSP